MIQSRLYPGGEVTETVDVQSSEESTVNDQHCVIFSNGVGYTWTVCDNVHQVRDGDTLVLYNALNQTEYDTKPTVKERWPMATPRTLQTCLKTGIAP